MKHPLAHIRERLVKQWVCVKQIRDAGRFAVFTIVGISVNGFG